MLIFQSNIWARLLPNTIFSSKHCHRHHSHLSKDYKDRKSPILIIVFLLKSRSIFKMWRPRAIYTEKIISSPRTQTNKRTNGQHCIEFTIQTCRSSTEIQYTAAQYKCMWFFWLNWLLLESKVCLCKIQSIPTIVKWIQKSGQRNRVLLIKWIKKKQSRMIFMRV